MHAPSLKPWQGPGYCFGEKPQCRKENVLPHLFPRPPSQSSAAHGRAVLALQPQQGAPLSHPLAKVLSAPSGCFTFPSPAPGKPPPRCRALTREDEEEGRHQAPRQPHGKRLCLGPLPEGWWKALMGDGDSHPAILKAAGRKLPGGGGFLCLEMVGRSWGAGCNSKVTRLWEVTAGIPAPMLPGQG